MEKTYTMADGQTLSRATIDSFPDELLVEIIDWCRLYDEYGWNYQRQWYNPWKVCRRWRSIMLEWAVRLKLCFLCNEVTPISTIPTHFTSIPLLLIFRFHPWLSPHSKKELLLALRHRDHVGAIFIKRWDLGGSELRKALDKVFPMLEALSLTEGCEIQQLPSDLVAPRLRTLCLKNIIIPKRSLLMTNATNLLSLRLESIPTSGDLRPEYLVERIACMPHLENMSIDSPLVSLSHESVIDFPDTQISRAVLPRLSRFIYSGISVYLESLLTRICTPVLQDFRVTPSSWDTPRILYNLPAFLNTIQNLNFRTAVLSFSTLHVTVTYHPEQPSAILPYLEFRLPNAWEQARAVASVAQICSTIAPALPAVENLVLTTDHFGMWGSSSLEPTVWHAFLRSFGGVKTLRTDMVLAEALSDALHPDNGTVVKELLPALSELEVLSSGGLVHHSLSSFIHSRRLFGHSIDLRVIHGRLTPWLAPRIPRYFDTLALIDHVSMA